MNLREFKLPENIANFGYVGERRAIALLCLGFYATVFSMMALAARNELPEWVACFAGLGLCYAVGFFGLAADYFWGRWFALGLGYSGVSMWMLAVVTTRELGGPMLVYGVMHGLISVCTLGGQMAAAYEGRPEWRARWQLDEAGVARVRRSVMRAATSLPSLIMFALAPREGQEAILALGVIGVIGLLRGRTWGVIALGTAGVATVAASVSAPAGVAAIPGVLPVATGALGLVAGLLLVGAAAPFVPAMVGFLARRQPRQQY